MKIISKIAAGCYCGKHIISSDGSYSRKVCIEKKRGYRVGQLCGGKQIRLGRLVCETFYGKPPTEKPIVDHINRIRTDDRIENLRWASYSENRINNPAYKDTCPHGHEYGGENLYIATYGKYKFRQCKTCHRKSAMKYYYKSLDTGVQG